MKVLEIKAITTLSHGRLNMAAGDTKKIDAHEARELEKAGLVTIAGEETDAEPAKHEKMAPIVSNKMEKPVANKSK